MPYLVKNSTNYLVLKGKLFYRFSSDSEEVDLLHYPTGPIFACIKNYFFTENSAGESIGF